MMRLKSKCPSQNHSDFYAVYHEIIASFPQLITKYKRLLFRRMAELRFSQVSDTTTHKTINNARMNEVQRRLRHSKSVNGIVKAMHFTAANQLYLMYTPSAKSTYSQQVTKPNSHISTETTASTIQHSAPQPIANPPHHQNQILPVQPMFMVFYEQWTSSPSPD